MFDLNKKTDEYFQIDVSRHYMGGKFTDYQTDPLTESPCNITETKGCFSVTPKTFKKIAKLLKKG